MCECDEWVSEWVSECARVCVSAWVCACVRACVRACVCVCMCALCTCVCGCGCLHMTPLDAAITVSTTLAAPLLSSCSCFSNSQASLQWNSCITYNVQHIIHESITCWYKQEIIAGVYCVTTTLSWLNVSTHLKGLRSTLRIQCFFILHQPLRILHEDRCTLSVNAI